MIFVSMAEQEINQKTADKEQTPSAGRLSNSIGMAMPDGTMRVFLPKGSRLPCEDASMRFLTRLKEYNKVKIQVFVGENNYADQNIFLGEVGLENIRLNKDGQALLDIVFHVDSNNLLHVHVKDEPGQNSSSATLRIPTESEVEPGKPGEAPSRRPEDSQDREILLDKLLKLEEKMEQMEKHRLSSETEEKEADKKKKTKKDD